MVKRPIDSFVEYFLDVKPYHTKILEVVERYLIKENIDVSFKENIFFYEIFGNRPLCNQIGYGVDFDDDCGYSSLSCCDLFQCIGGYGLIYDNSDLLLEVPVVASDNAAATVSVSGDYRFDSYINIDQISDDHTIKLKGNHIALMSDHALFLIEPVNTYLIAETVANGFYVYGNVEAQFNAKSEFTVINSSLNDNDYSTVEAKYIHAEQRTFIQTFVQQNNLPNDQTSLENYSTGSLDVNSLGTIIISSGTKNNGAYRKTATYFDGTHTIIELSQNTLIKLPDETRHGSVVFRTALKPGRRVFLKRVAEDILTSSDPIETLIEDSTYDPETNQTVLTVQLAMVYDRITGDTLVWQDLADIETVQLRGYFFPSGFDGYQECSTPKEYNISSAFQEFLAIEEIIYVTPEPVDENWIGDFDILISDYQPSD